MFRYLAVFCMLLLLSSCASSTKIIPTLSNEAAASMRQGKMTVVFFDSKETVNYIIEIYEVLNITHRKVNSSYQYDFSTEEFINNIHLREFAKYGLKVRMFSEIFSKKDLEKVRQMQQQLNDEKKSNSETKFKLTTEVKKLLQERQIENLVVIDWSGFSLFIKGRGLPANNITTTNYYVFNVNSGNLAWSGSTTANLPIDLRGKDGRIYLESNDYAQLKYEIKRLLQSLYDPSKNNIWKIMGLTY